MYSKNEKPGQTGLMLISNSHANILATQKQLESVDTLIQGDTQQ
jgi:hypothetical protein